MSKSTKRICIWVCLLLLLIIVCTLRHMNSIKLSEPVEINAPVIATPVAKKPINSTSTKEKEEAEKARIEAEAKAQKEKEEAEKARIEAEAKAQKEKEAEKAKIIEAEIKKIIDFEDINFELDKTDLTPKSLETINKIAKILKEHQNVKVEIAGHTDSQGNDAYNLKLSQGRVDSVKKALVELGISSERLNAIGYGETKPLVSNDTKENRQKNRRVEFKVIGE